MIQFIMNNWHTILLIYTVIAVIVVIAMAVFWVWVIKADDKEREMFPEEYEDMGDGILPIGMAIFTSVGCALLWIFIPVLLVGLLFYDWIQWGFPNLMGNMYENIEEENDND